VLMDDRDERAGVKFKDADLVGIPWRIIIGEKNLKDGLVELKERKTGSVEKVKIAEGGRRCREEDRDGKTHEVRSAPVRGQAECGVRNERRKTIRPDIEKIQGDHCGEEPAVPVEDGRRGLRRCRGRHGEDRTLRILLALTHLPG